MRLEGIMCFDIEDDCKLESLISSDNKQDFVSFLKRQPNTISHTKLFRLLCSHRAIDCATALLDGQTGLTVDLNVPLQDGLTPLAISAKNLSFGLTELFLKHVADPNFCGDDPKLDLLTLPLRLALDALCNHELMTVFTCDVSVYKEFSTTYKLLSTFWHHDLKEPLDTIKLLASRTKQVDRVGCRCVEEYNLVKVAALMLVAWDKLVIDHDIYSGPIGLLISVQPLLESDTGKVEIARSMWDALIILERSRNFVEVYRTTSMVKHEVVPLEVAHQLLTDVKPFSGHNHLFSANLDRLAANLQLEDKVFLETALAKKICLYPMIFQHIHFTPKSPQKIDDEQIHYDSYYKYIECAMRLDDRDEFVRLVNSVGTFYPLYTKSQVVETVRTSMFLFDSAHCAAAVLAGETNDIFSLRDLSGVGWSFLHKAAELANPKLTSLFLENGFLADERRDYDELNLQAVLPLNVALENIRSHYLMRGWKDNKSAINLVVLLCDNSFRDMLETIRLLAQKTTNVYFEILRYLEDVKMVELGALMMVGCREFLPSSFVTHTFLSKAPTHNTRVVGPMQHFSISSGHKKLNEDNDSLERKGTLLLIDIFEQIGDYLGAYLRLEENKSYDQIDSEISWIILRAGISEVNGPLSRWPFCGDQGRILGLQYRNMVEQRSVFKVLPISMFSKQASPSILSKKGTSTMVLSHSLHTSVLKVDADLTPLQPAKTLICVLQRLHSPMRCDSVVSALKRGIRRI